MWVKNKGHAQARTWVFLMSGWRGLSVHQRECVSGHRRRTGLPITTVMQEALLPPQLQAAVAQPHPLPLQRFPHHSATGLSLRSHTHLHCPSHPVPPPAVHTFDTKHCS